MIDKKTGQNRTREVAVNKSNSGQNRDSERFRAVVEGAPNAIVMVDERGAITLVNSQTEKLFGYDRDELLGQPIENLVPERFRDHHPSLRAAYFKDPTVRAMGAGRELFGLRKDGSEMPVEIGLNPISTQDGRFVLASIIDISERKRAEAAREESEQRYAELVDQALEGIAVRKPGGEFLFVNDTFCRMLGYPRADFLRMNIKDVVHPDDAETIAQAQRLNNGGSLHLEKRMRRKDGSTLHVEVSVRRLQDGNFQSTIQDISERRHSEERFRVMVEGAPNAMVMTGLDGVITMVNFQTERLFGYTREELLGLPIDRLIPERFRAAHPELRNGYSRDPQMRAMGSGRDLYGLRKNGVEVPVEIGLNPITTHDGHFVLASIIDITARREAEQRERVHSDELRLMSQRLLEAQETERRAIARELHDEIGQALTATRMNLRDLEQQAGDGPLGKCAADASAIVAQLLQQVRQLSLDLHPTVLDDLGLAASLRWLARTRAGGGQLNVVLGLEEDMPRFTSVVEHTAFRVFQEALSNVLRHSGARNLKVKLKLDGDWLLMEIHDDGKGFDPGAARKHALAGASLGVIGMQERVRLADGRIDIESKPEQGTLVRVSLPAAER